MAKKGAPSVRVFVAMAVVKLLRFLPQKEFDDNLPGLIASMNQDMREWQTKKEEGKENVMFFYCY